MQNLLANNMINGQLITGDVIDETLLDALASVNRSDFVPEQFKNVAYIDEEIALGNGRFLIEPLVFARILKYAAITKSETVLDVGCATGYSTAVISQLAGKVIAIEENKELAAKAKSIFIKYQNIRFFESELKSGYEKEAPYDVIIIEGAIEIEPKELFVQLREGGRLLAIEHTSPEKISYSGLGKLVEYKKIAGIMYKTMLHDASSHLLEQFRKTASFVF